MSLSWALKVRGFVSKASCTVTQGHSKVERVASPTAPSTVILRHAICTLTEGCPNIAVAALVQFCLHTLQA